MALHQAPSVAKSPGRALTERFRELGLTRDFIRHLTERGDDLRNPLTPTREALYRDEPATFALRLLFCGRPISEQETNIALGDPLFQHSLDAGLLVSHNTGVHSPFHLRLVRGLYLFSDYLGDEPNAVMGAGETTGLLYQASNWNRPKGRVLDLGCGAGTIALLSSFGAEHVIGTDVNERAVALAAWNASVNGITNSEFRVGSLYQPVENEQFDVIVSQPPYYPAPADTESSLVYLHGGTRGDELAVQIVDGVPDHLMQTGRALIFTSWLPDSPRRAPVHMRVLELTTNRKEVHGTRQSLNVIEYARDSAGVWNTFAVPADDWGAVSPERIDQLLESTAILTQPDEALLQRTLHLPQSVACTQEGDNVILRFLPESLIGCIAIDETMWNTLQVVNEGSNIGEAISAGCNIADIRQALQRGWLVPTTSIA